MAELSAHGDSRAPASAAGPAIEFPVDHLRDPLAAALAEVGRAVVVAPPGAGKSTRLPLWLLPRSPAKIILLQPRRLAALHVARFLAASTGTPLGQTVGVNTRYERQVSAHTRLEVLTEGVFLRRIQADPLLEEVGLVLFDEFHERNWQCDLALAFAREAQAARERPQDLGLILMSATVDGERWADWLQAPLLRCEGRQYPVEIDYAPAGRQPWEQHATARIGQLLNEGARRVLVFLPGVRWIRDLERQLRSRSPQLPVWPLHASLPADQQARALLPPQRPDVVLATNIAQTSLTIEGVDAVLDTGLARRAVFDPRSGRDVLELAPIARDAADQRAGRAGRLGPGRCLRLWDREQHGRRSAAETPEIERVDLAPLALELAAWGGAVELPEPPDAARLAAAHELLRWLQALDDAGRITATGRQMAAMGLHPRLARLVIAGTADQGPGQASDTAGSAACLLAALLSETASLAPGIDLTAHWHALWESRSDRSGPAMRISHLARRLAQRSGVDFRPPGPAVPDNLESLLFTGFADRVARRRSMRDRRYLLSSGGEVALPAGSGLDGCEWLLVLASGGGRDGEQVQLALPLSCSAQQTVRQRASWHDTAVWDPARERVTLCSRQMYGKLMLAERHQPAAAEQARPVLLAELRQRGLEALRWPERVHSWLARVRWLSQGDTAATEAWTERGLLEDIDHWLLPWIDAIGLPDLRRLDPMPLLKARLGAARAMEMDRAAPEYFLMPNGRRRMLDYSGDVPALKVRFQELFGSDSHPTVGSPAQPLRLMLLSPAGRVAHITQDLPGFWRGAWIEVAKELRGRYPKHAWPAEPWRAEPR